MSYLVYRATTEPPALTTPDPAWTISLWRPSVGDIMPPGVHGIPFRVWWLFHNLHLFANQDYAILVIYDRDRLIHRSCVFPRYPRFPFMRDDDLQIGDTWTDPAYRGRGIATLAIREVLIRMARPGRAFWYVVESENVASVRVIERAGFTQLGKSVRTSRLGLRLLGAFVLTQ